MALLWKNLWIILIIIGFSMELPISIWKLLYVLILPIFLILIILFVLTVLILKIALLVIAQLFVPLVKLALNFKVIILNVKEYVVKA
jgi:hypothetical protein